MLFRDIDLINAGEVPKEGPLIIYGNHNNQFVDGMVLTSPMQLLMRMTPRVVSFVAAAKSMRRPIVGKCIQMANAIPLERAQDVAVAGPGAITSLKGSILRGRNTKFTTLQVGSSIECGEAGELRVVAITSDEEVSVANEAGKEFEKELKYKVIPKLDYNELYQHVWESLRSGSCIGIFPEGGSHDRTELLPLKAGICIMALGAMAKFGIKVRLVSCGFTYYQPEKFRSKVIMEYGHPYTIPDELVELYRTDKRRAIANLLSDIEEVLVVLSRT